MLAFVVIAIDSILFAIRHEKILIDPEVYQCFQEIRRLQLLDINHGGIPEEHRQ